MGEYSAHKQPCQVGVESSNPLGPERRVGELRIDLAIGLSLGDTGVGWQGAGEVRIDLEPHRVCGRLQLPEKVEPV